MTLVRTHVEVYLFRRRAARLEFLSLRRSPGHTLPGAWQPVTGKVQLLERAYEAAAREVLEETGLAPIRWWALESVSIYFDARADKLRALPLFAAEVEPDASVLLSREHDAFRWSTAAAAGASFVWEAQRRGLEAVRREVLDRPALAEALDITALVRAKVKRKRSRGAAPTRAPRARKR